MGQEITRVEETPIIPAHRGGLPGAANVGAVSVEMERAIAEVQGQIIIAKRFPRDLVAAHAEIMETCRLAAMAEVAFYKVPRGGGTVSGPSIRLAEELVRVCGNIEYGHIELSRDDGKSEVEVYAWDKQTNTRRRRQVTVLHVIDTKNGPKACRDQKDIDDLIANKASKQMRGLMLSLIPPWLKQDAIDQCKKTLAGDNGGETIAQRVRKMTQAFAPFGVTVEMLEKHVGHKLDATTVDELVEMSGIFNAIREGGKASEYFGADDEGSKSDTAAALTGAGRASGDGEKKTPPRGAQKPADGQQQSAGKSEGEQSDPEPKDPPKPAQETAPEPPPAEEPKAEPQPQTSAPAGGNEAVF